MPWGVVAAVGAAAVSSDAQRSASNTAADASREATAASTAASNRQADLAERQYNDYVDKYQPLQLEQMRAAIDSGKTAEDRASKSFDFDFGNAQKYSDRYWKTQVPLEDGLVSDAQKFSTDAEFDRQAGLATTDTRAAYSDMRGMMDRDNQRRGVNPNSGAALSMAQDAYMQEALSGASAATKARFQAQQVGFQRKADVAALGRGLPGFSSSSSALANGATGTGMQAGSMPLAATISASGAANSAFGTGSNIWGASSASAGAGANAFNQSLNTAYRSPGATFGGALAGGLMNYGMNNLPRGGFSFGSGYSMPSAFSGSNGGGSVTALGGQEDGFTTNPQGGY